MKLAVPFVCDVGIPDTIEATLGVAGRTGVGAAVLEVTAAAAVVWGSDVEITEGASGVAAAAEVLLAGYTAGLGSGCLPDFGSVSRSQVAPTVLRVLP